MKKVYIGSTNPVKIEAVRDAFKIIYSHEEFEFFGASADSRVRHQPEGDEETLRGAINRTESIFKKYPNGNFWIGVEGGIEMIQDEMHAFAWIVVKNSESIGKARSASFSLPHSIRKLIVKGYELGEADDMVFRRNNSKQQDGTVGILTGGIIDRRKYYEHAIILAMIPFKNKYLFA